MDSLKGKFVTSEVDHSNDGNLQRLSSRFNTRQEVVDFLEYHLNPSTSKIAGVTDRSMSTLEDHLVDNPVRPN